MQMAARGRTSARDAGWQGEPELTAQGWSASRRKPLVCPSNEQQLTKDIDDCFTRAWVPIHRSVRSRGSVHEIGNWLEMYAERTSGQALLCQQLLVREYNSRLLLLHCCRFDDDGCGLCGSGRDELRVVCIDRR